MHDLIREFLTSSMDDVMRKELHENAASHYRLHRSSRMDDLEFLHHLAEAGNTDEFAQILGEVGKILFLQAIPIFLPSWILLIILR